MPSLLRKQQQQKQSSSLLRRIYSNIVFLPLGKKCLLIIWVFGLVYIIFLTKANLKFTTTSWKHLDSTTRTSTTFETQGIHDTSNEVVHSPTMTTTTTISAIHNDTNKKMSYDDSNIETAIAPRTQSMHTKDDMSIQVPPPVLPRDHPHAGAKFANGSWGYIADTTRVRRWMVQRYRPQDKEKYEPTRIQQLHDPPLSYLPIQSKEELDTICNVAPKMGSEKKAGWRLLANTIQIANETYSVLLNEDTDPTHQNQKNRQRRTSSPKLLCTVYTYEKHHEQVRAIVETWGWKCDGFVAASTQTVDNPNDVGYGAINLPHFGRERYQNMWSKTRSIWAYIYDHYVNDYDYFYLSGDDTHVIVENLRSVLAAIPRSSQQYPIYLGHFIPDPTTKSGYFCGGGPGYVLNRAAVQILVEQILPNCHVDVIEAAEDRLLGDCFSRFDIVGNHSVDQYGKQQFHGMHPNFIASYKATSKPYFQNMYQYWGKLYGYRTGIDLVSNYSVSFHLLKSPEMLKRHHAIIYKSCPQGTVLGDYFSNKSGGK